MSSDKKIIFLGTGVSGLTTLFYLLKSSPCEFDAIDLISSESFVPATSHRTTSIVAYHGTKKRISPLGDLIVDSVDGFANFYDQVRPLGVDKGVHTHLFKSGEDRGATRFDDLRQGAIECLRHEWFFSHEPCFYIDSHIFLEDLLEKSKAIAVEKGIKLNEVSSMVTNIDRDQKVLQCLGEKDRNWDLLINCSGHFSKDLGSEKSSKNVPGTYLYCKSPFSISRSQSFTIGGANFILRKSDQMILIGGTTTNHSDNPYMADDISAISELYEVFTNVFEFPLPSFGEFSASTGIRVKGQKRTPWIYDEDDYFEMGGLYKNGFSFPFSLAPKLVKKVISRL